MSSAHNIKNFLIKIIIAVVCLSPAIYNRRSSFMSIDKDAPPPLALVNGKIYTANPKNLWAEAVLVKDKKVIFLGKEAHAHPLFTEDTEVIDLEGKLVVPRNQSFPDLESVVRAQINNTANAIHEKNTSFIELGKYTDMVVLDRNIFSIPKNEISQTKIVYTILNGLVVNSENDDEKSK